MLEGRDGAVYFEADQDGRMLCEGDGMKQKLFLPLFLTLILGVCTSAWSEAIDAQIKDISSEVIKRSNVHEGADHMITIWWHSPMAIYNQDTLFPKIFFGYCENRYKDDANEHNAAGVAQHNLENGMTHRTELAENTSYDDHGPAVCEFMDCGRILAVTGRGHSASLPQGVYISVNPDDIRSFRKVHEFATGKEYAQILRCANKWWLFARATRRYQYSKSEDAETWSAYETIVHGTKIQQRVYPIFRNTDDPNVFEMTVYYQFDDIRLAYFHCDTGKIYDGDNTTELGDINDPGFTGVPYEKITPIITPPAEHGVRLLDSPYEAIIGDPKILYELRTPRIGDSEYRLYHNGNDMKIAGTGARLYHSYPGGGCFGSIDSDKIYISRENGGTWYLEEYEYDDMEGTVSLERELYRDSNHKVCRPAGVKYGNYLLYFVGEGRHYTDFRFKAKIIDLDAR